MKLAHPHHVGTHVLPRPLTGDPPSGRAPLLLGVAVLALAALAAACDDGTQGSGDAGPQVDGAPAADAGAADAPVIDGAPATDAGADRQLDALAPQLDAGPPASCLLHAGVNTGFKVDGIDRSFILHFPATVWQGAPLPVVFVWHGVNGTADVTQNWLAPYVNTPGFPFVTATIEDTDYKVYGVYNSEWEVFSANAATNREGRLVDELLTALGACFTVDQERIHTLGFSMGGITNDMLAVIRESRWASVATMSGAYLSNQANLDELGMLLSGLVDWPMPANANRFAQMVLHGGPSDTYTLFSVKTIQFDTFAVNDAAYLNAHSRDVVLCNHGQGHPDRYTVPPMGAQIVQFFRDHPKGTTASPYASGLPATMTPSCEFRAKQ